MNKMPERKVSDPDLLGSLPALKRSAAHAHERAQLTQTPCWVMRQGVLVDARTGQSYRSPLAVKR